MILWLSIVIVAVGCAALALVLLRRRRKHDPLALTGTVMAVLALIFACGVAIQQYVDSQRDATIAARRDALMIAQADVLAQIQREMIRTDISPLAKQERLSILLRRYDRIRAAIAEMSGVAPAPALSVSLTAAPASLPLTNEITTGEVDTATEQANITSPPRGAPSTDDDEAVIAPAAIRPPPTATPPPPPPPPPPF